MEFIQPLGDLFELRVLLFQLRLPALHKGGAVLAIVSKDAHTLCQAFRAVLHKQVFTEQAVFLFVVQVQAVQGCFQAGGYVLAVCVRQVAYHNLPGNSVAVCGVGRQLVGIAAGGLVIFLDTLVAVDPRLIKDAGFRLDLLAYRPGVGCALLPQTDRAGCRVCIQGVIGVDLVGQLLDQGRVLCGKAVQEILGEYRVINGCGFPVLEELADILCQALAVPLLFAVSVFHFAQGVFQFRFHFGREGIAQQAVTVVQGVAQLVGNGGQVVCNFGADTLVALVVLAAYTCAAHVAAGDIQAKVVPDLLHDLGKAHGGFVGAAYALCLPAFRVGRCVVGHVIVHHAFHVALVLCGGQCLLAGWVQLCQNFSLAHTCGNQLLGPGKWGVDGLFQLGEGCAVFVQTGFRDRDHVLQAAGDIFKGRNGTGGTLHIHGAAILGLAAQQHIALAGNVQVEAREAAYLCVALGGVADIQRLFRKSYKSLSCGLSLRVGLTAQGNAKLVTLGVPAACKVASVPLQVFLVPHDLLLRLNDTLFRLGHFLCVGAFQVF